MHALDVAEAAFAAASARVADAVDSPLSDIEVTMIRQLTSSPP